MLRVEDKFHVFVAVEFAEEKQNITAMPGASKALKRLP